MYIFALLRRSNMFNLLKIIFYSTIAFFSRSKQPKEVVQYKNPTNPHRCLICIYKLYMSRCPPANAFYLESRTNPDSDIWFTTTPCGHNPCTEKVVLELMKKAGFIYYFSLWASGVNEHLIISRTGHLSKEVWEPIKEQPQSLKRLSRIF